MDFILLQKKKGTQNKPLPHWFLFSLIPWCSSQESLSFSDSAHVSHYELRVYTINKNTVKVQVTCQRVRNNTQNFIQAIKPQLTFPLTALGLSQVSVEFYFSLWLFFYQFFFMLYFPFDNFFKSFDFFPPLVTCWLFKRCCMIYLGSHDLLINGKDCWENCVLSIFEFNTVFLAVQ